MSVGAGARASWRLLVAAGRLAADYLLLLYRLKCHIAAAVPFTCPWMRAPAAASALTTSPCLP